MSSSCFILQCSFKKRPRSLLGSSFPAKEMYQGNNFKKIYQLVSVYGYDIFIMSAKYGIIHENHVVDPYNHTLETVPPAHIRLFTKEYRDSYKEAGLKAQSDLVPIVKTQLESFDKYDNIFTIFSQAYKKVYLKAGGDHTKTHFLQDNCGGTFTLLKNVNEKLKTLI